MHARPAPRESMRDERNREAAFSPRPVSGLAIYRPAFPRVMRSGMMARCRKPFRAGKQAGNGQDSALEDRLATCVAVAYRCGGSAGWLVLADFAPCFPFNCAHWIKHARAPRCPEFKSGTKVRQESGTMRLCRTVKDSWRTINALDRAFDSPAF
jgi:hypothetical protein